MIPAATTTKMKKDLVKDYSGPSKAFTLQKAAGNARAGKIKTAHGTINTPFFMPVGTRAAVKTLSPAELLASGVGALICNTYHLYLRPGEEPIHQAGGLRRFMGWEGVVVTDSGGFQIFSLGAANRVSDQGIDFQSHLDGSRHLWTPEKAMAVQYQLGADIIMMLDECPAYPNTPAAIERAVARTTQWGERSLLAHQQSAPVYGYQPLLFGIVQGGVHKHLRETSVQELCALSFDGYAIGGLSVGEPKQDLETMTAFCAQRLPAGKPRYLMGVGTPADILHAIECGVDMFDCVLPTRNARNGMVFTSCGARNLRNAQYANMFSQPIDPACNCFACCNFSLGYVRHLIASGELLGLRLASLHNVHFYTQLLATAREKILVNQFSEWKKLILTQI